ncbi:MAG: hypothetical protein ACJ76J_02825 [Thermoanaerobaculia bacterium]
MDNTKEREKKRLFHLADRLARSTDGKEQQRLKKELACLTFGGAKDPECPSSPS